MNRKDYNFYLKNYETYQNDPILTSIDKSYIKYHIPKYRYAKEREEQERFRMECLEKYDNQCIISGVQYPIEACHIIPVSRGGKYDSYSNSLLLDISLHRGFDNGFWTIHPETGKIELSEEIRNINLSIKKYIDIDINYWIEGNDELKRNLAWHYENIYKK